ncbi:MAG: DUF4384 domain-containing protein [Victivallales bacterium]|nr:DUF4384 domain-containing protein [Victivallales bacterium]
MSNDERFIVVRELYPESKGFFFKKQKCAEVDDAREIAFGMNASGTISRLADEHARNAAVRNGERIFAVTKRNVPFSTVVLHVCEEDGYQWNYALEGSISISAHSSFLASWAQNEGDCGLEGIDSEHFTHRIMTLLEPSIKDMITECHNEHGYHVADIEEKDVLPVSFWSNAFSRLANPLLAGLKIDIGDKAFLSPERDMEAKIIAAAEAQREREQQMRTEYEAAINSKKAEAELAEFEREQKRAELDFKLEMAEKEMAIHKCKMETFQLENLKKDKEEITIALEKANGNSERMEKLSTALAEASAKIIDMAGKLEKLGAVVEESQKNFSKIDAVVAPRYQGMSENYLSVIRNLRNGVGEGIAVSLEVARRSEGYARKDLVPMRSNNEPKTFNGRLHIGDRMTLRLKCTCTGYLTLFNFGTSGNVSKIFPHPAFGTSNNRIEAGHVYMLPGELMPLEVFSGGHWEETGPVSTVNGLPECIIALLTDVPLEIDETAFAALVGKALHCRDLVAVENAIAGLLGLPEGSWHWKMLDAWVEA